jgi:rhodanese-related sulfurtransferase
MQDITVQELKHKLDAGEKFVFIDVREPWEHEEFNIGAQLMPLNDFIANAATVLDEHKEDEIVLHCKSGARSGMAKQVLVAAGFTNVRNTLGGIMEWRVQYGA